MAVALLVGAALFSGCNSQPGLRADDEASAEASGTTAVPRQENAAVEPPPYDPRTVQPYAPVLDEREVREAVNEAFGDERLSGFLAAHEHGVHEVREAAGGRTTVTVRLERPVPPEDEDRYPLDVCDVSAKSENVTGVVWLVDKGEVAAVSPEWDNGTSCLSGL